MEHPPEQIEAAAELINDGHSPADAAALLMETFNISESTAKRRVRAARDEIGADLEPRRDDAATDYVALALAALADSVDAARNDGDWEAVAVRAEKLGTMASKLRIRYAPRP